MTNSDGPGSSGRIIEDQYITAPISAGTGIPCTGLLPGVYRGLTASQGGTVSATRCYKNRWWIRLSGHEGPRMGKKEALALMAELEGKLL